ncbi:hypothetical protein Chor_001214 [Crotalus horridus]
MKFLLRILVIFSLELFGILQWFLVIPIYWFPVESMLQILKTMGPFFSTLLLPYRFTDVIPKILVFTQNKKSTLEKIEKRSWVSLITRMGCHCLGPNATAWPLMLLAPTMPTLSTESPIANTTPLPQPMCTITYNIAETLNFFKVCHEYSVTDDNLIQTPFAMLDMPNDQILANLDCIIKDICKHKSSKYDVKVEGFLSEESLGRQLEETERISEEEKQEPDD